MAKVLRGTGSGGSCSSRTAALSDPSLFAPWWSSILQQRPLLIGRQSTQRFLDQAQEQFIHLPLPLHRQQIGILLEISVRLSLKPPWVTYGCTYGRTHGRMCEYVRFDLQACVCVCVHECVLAYVCVYSTYIRNVSLVRTYIHVVGVHHSPKSCPGWSKYASSPSVSSCDSLYGMSVCVPCTAVPCT